MQLHGLFLNSGIRGRLERKDYRVVVMVSTFIEAYFDGSREFRGDANMTGPHRIYFNKASKAVTRNCGRERSVAKAENWAELFVRSNIRSQTRFCQYADPHCLR